MRQTYYKNRPMLMLRDLTNNYLVDTGSDELFRRLRDKKLVDSKVEEIIGQTT